MEISPAHDAERRLATPVGHDLAHYITLDYATLESVAPTRLRRQSKDSVVPMTAVFEVDRSPTGDGTRIRAPTDIRIVDGTWCVPLFRCMLKLFGGARRGLTYHYRKLAEGLGVSADFA